MEMDNMIKFEPTDDLYTVDNWYILIKKIKSLYGDYPICFDPEIFKEPRNKNEIYYTLDKDKDSGVVTVFVSLKEKDNTVSELKTIYKDLYNIVLKNKRRAEFLESRCKLSIEEQRELTVADENYNEAISIANRVSRLLREHGWVIKNE